MGLDGIVIGIGIWIGFGIGIEIGIGIGLDWIGLDWIGLDWIGLDLDWIVLTLIKFKQAAKSNMHFDIDCRWKNK